jgi:hypothetical protein
MNPVKLFYSYSHKDEEWRDELEKQLIILQRNEEIEQWHDRRIAPGDAWEPAIVEHLHNADIILLLISPDFLASDFCYNNEMKRAMERNKAGEARVIPVMLRTVANWRDTPFAELQGLPKDMKPVRKWGDTDEAFANIAEGISRVVRELKRRP